MKVPRVVMDRAYSTYEENLEREVTSGVMPKHIAIIMDGNRRYARDVLKEEPMKGHILGKQKLREVVEWIRDLGIKCLTVYAFSTENFKRDKEEVQYIMKLLEEALYEFADDPEVHKNKLALRVIGDMDLLPESVVKAVDYAYSKTADYKEYTLNLAIAYGGRQDIVMAVRDIATKVKNGEMSVDDIDVNTMSSYISTQGLPDPDLVLRTSGEIRLSNFLLWQMAYSELYFTDVCWPGFRYIDLLRAIREFQMRQRRYGA